MPSISGIDWTQSAYRSKWNGESKKFEQQDLATLKTVEGFEGFDPATATQKSITDTITHADFLAMAGADSLLSDDEIAVYINKNKSSSDQPTKDKVNKAIILLNSPSLFNQLDKGTNGVANQDRLIYVNDFLGTNEYTSGSGTIFKRMEAGRWDDASKTYKADQTAWGKVITDPETANVIDSATLHVNAKGYDELIANWGNLGKTPSGAINAEILFSAVASGKLTGDAKGAALALAYDADSLNKADGSDKNGEISLEDLKRVKGSLTTGGGDEYTAPSGKVYKRSQASQYNDGYQPASSEFLTNITAEASTGTNDWIGWYRDHFKSGLTALSRNFNTLFGSGKAIKANDLFTAVMTNGNMTEPEKAAAIVLLSKPDALNALDTINNGGKEGAFTKDQLDAYTNTLT